MFVVEAIVNDFIPLTTTSIPDAVLLATEIVMWFRRAAAPPLFGYVVFIVDLIANGFIQYTEHAIPLLPEGVRDRRGIDRERLYPVDDHRLCDFKNPRREWDGTSHPSSPSPCPPLTAVWPLPFGICLSRVSGQ